MAGKLRRTWRGGILLRMLALAPLLLAGCSAGPGGTRFTLFPQRSTLLDSARASVNADQEAAKAAAKSATDPFAKALAEFSAARGKALAKLLESIPTD